MFRAKTIDGKEVFGWLTYFYGKTLIIEEIGEAYKMLDHTYKLLGIFHEVTPSTIAMKTGQTDKNKKDIYGSFDLEGFGMTKGGDVVEYVDWNSVMDNEMINYGNVDFGSDGITFTNRESADMQDIYYDRVKIIGKQYEETK